MLQYIRKTLTVFPDRNPHFWPLVAAKRGQFVTGASNKPDQTSHDEAVIKALFDALDAAGELSPADRASNLLTATTVILRELAQIPGPFSANAIRTIHELTTEYVNRTR